MVTSFYTKYDGIHFVFNSLSLLGLSLVPKFPQMYKVRLFGLNKYWTHPLDNMEPTGRWSIGKSFKIEIYLPGNCPYLEI